MPACVIDNDLVVRAWSAGAEALTGFEAKDVVGLPCWTVVGIRDEHGMAICSSACALAERVRAGGVELDRSILIGASGSTSAARMVTMPVVCGVEQGLVHIFVSDALISARGVAPRLTRRQSEVLAMLDKGMATKEIANDLGISVHTARHHVQAILRRLDSPTQLHALHTARRHGLV